MGLSILFTNIVLAGRSGTEVATLELAQGLRRHGHEVVIFSPTLGKTADHARSLGIPVTSRVETISFVPDVIHGNHNIPLAIAMVRFPETPALFVCHDTATWFDEPFLDERIGLYIGVDAACRGRLLTDGVKRSKILIIPNAVDLDVFSIREQWRPRPEKALLIIKHQARHVAVVKEACVIAGIELEVVGVGVGNVVTDLAQRCRGADLVLAHSRSAIEAACTGAAVIIIDEFGYGGWLDSDQVARWPESLLSNRILFQIPGAQDLAETMLGYSPAAAKSNTEAVRNRVGLSRVASEWSDAYLLAIEGASVARQGAAAHGTAGQGSLAGFVSRFMPRVDLSTLQREAEERVRHHGQVLASFGEFARAVTGEATPSIRFRHGSLGQFLLTEDWYPVEPNGVWSATERADVWLPEVVLAEWGFMAKVECHCFLPIRPSDDPVRSVAVSVGEQRLATWQFSPMQPDGPEQKILEIPASLRPKPGSALKLTFHIDRLIAPSDVGESTDGRRLGVMLTAFHSGDRDAAASL